MVDSGIPISQAVRSLSEQTSNPYLKEVLEYILRDIENGYAFSNALKKYPHIFNQVFVSVIAAGETTGRLNTTLLMLADELERDQNFQSRFLGALLYPAFIIVAMVVVALIMVTRIVPALEQVFKETDIELPWTTKLVVAITNSLINYWYIYIAVIFLVVYLFIRYLASEDGRRSFNSFMLRIPIFGTMLLNMEMTRFTRIFGMMTAAGVPIIQTLDSVAQISSNVIIRQGLNEVARNVERGSPMSQSLSRFPVFPATITQMVAVGEQTGKLEQIFTKLADFYEAETDQSLKNITALTEPIVFVIVGLGVAFLVFSIIVPIYNLAGTIN